MTSLLIAIQQAEDVAEAMTKAAASAAAEAAKESVNWNDIIPQLIEWCVKMGGNLLSAFIIFIVGRFIISLIKRALNAFLERRKVEPTVKSFVKSMVSVALSILLAIAIISRLGIETTSFAALLASAGVAIGMAFSGNLQNFAGGVIMLVLRPFKVGDYVVAQGVEGYVKEIQIFHTVLTTYDNRTIYVANGPLSSGVITNMSQQVNRRVDWTVSVEYGADFDKVKAILLKIIDKEPLILKDPAPFVALKELSNSSVDLIVRVWVKSADYWDVYYELRREVYEAFNKEGIGFPFPQITVHQAEK
ncbi:MAG: mechanosensitive ion channel [Bacteroidaceae bacterium]|nr:mechanosensitive ion channel [Bacteroidaceae bacterium]MBR3716389.1 mechanosensitive ion channel [Bacteroidaceae bacterium]